MAVLADLAREVATRRADEDLLARAAAAARDLLGAEAVEVSAPTPSGEVRRVRCGPATPGGEPTLRVPIPEEGDAGGEVVAFGVPPTEGAADALAVLAGLLGAALACERTAGRLRDSEARARAVLDTTVDGVITIDAHGRIVAFNAAAERIFGYTAEEIQGRNVSLLMPEPYHTEHDGYLQAYHETGRRRIIGIGREVTGRRKDGSTFPMDLAVSEVPALPGEPVRFTGIVRDISERRRLEQEVLRISDEERRRIGQDLHDGLGQQLTGIGLIVRSLARHLRREGHRLAETAEEVTALLSEADQTARRLARGLVPVELGETGLPSALARLADRAERFFGVTCTFESYVEDAALFENPEVATHLYRIAQEAVSNAARHGHARHVRIVLAAGPQRLRLRIQDDGHGLPEEPPRRDGTAPRGMGIPIMHYRARIIGGSLDLRPGPDGGTVVTCTIPPSSDTVPLRTRSAIARVPA